MPDTIVLSSGFFASSWPLELMQSLWRMREQNGSHVVGQNAISHPEPTTMTSAVHGQPAAAAAVAAAGPSLEGTTGLFLGEDDQLGHQDSAPVDGKNPNLIVSKEVDVPLPSRIRQLYYINNYGLRVQPRPNPRYIQALTERDMLVYACGSLYTSIMPCLALPGVAQAIAAAPSRGSARLKSKVLLLNSLPDRETPRGYTAVDYIQAIQKCLNSNLDPTTTPGAPFAPSRYMSVRFSDSCISCANWLTLQTWQNALRVCRRFRDHSRSGGYQGTTIHLAYDLKADAVFSFC